MIETRGATPTFRALLVGADYYFPNLLPSGATYPKLSGCVRDVTRVEQMLRARVDAPLDIVKLTASNSGGARPPEPESAWPTYANLKAQLDALLDRAMEGDQVYIHYSGHGGRVPTKWPEKKGATGVDETIVPIDIADKSVRNLRDLDLAFYLDRLVNEKKAVVTLVLDCCHSGGTIRDSATPRRAEPPRGSKSDDDLVDTTPRPTDGVADEETLRAAWNRLAEGGLGQRALSPARLLPESRGYVCLAACRDIESALEMSIDSGPRGGVLTAAYLAAVQELGTDQSYRTLYDRILAWVSSREIKQSPQLLGDPDRQVLGVALRRVQYSVIVGNVQADRRRVSLSAGQVAGIAKGAKFGVYRPGTIDFSRADLRVGGVTVDEVAATASWAVPDDDVAITAIELGAPARYEDVGAVALRRTIALVQREDLDPGIDQATPLAAVRAALESGGHGFLDVASAAEGASYQIALTPSDEYEIRDPSGQRARSVGPIAASAPSAARIVVDRLLHMLRYQTILAIDDPLSGLKDSIAVELQQPPAGWTKDQPPQGGTALALRGDAFVVAPDAWLFVRVANRATSSVNVVALDFVDDWTIAAVHPPPPAGQTMPTRRYETIPAGKDFTFAFQAYLPPGRTETLDVIKVFATVQDTEFWWLLHPSIEEPVTRSATTRSGAATDALARLRQTLDADTSTTRAVRPVSSPGEDWTTRQFRLITRPT